MLMYFNCDAGGDKHPKVAFLLQVGGGWQGPSAGPNSLVPCKHMAVVPELNWEARPVKRC